MARYQYTYNDLADLFTGHRTLGELQERWATARLSPLIEEETSPPPEPVSEPRRFPPPSATEPAPPANSNGGVRVCACDKPMLELHWTGFNSRLTASCLKCGRDAEQPADRRFDPDDAPSREFRSMAAANRGLRYV